MTYKIEKHVARPSRMGRKGESKYPLAKMKAGESFAVPLTELAAPTPIYTVAKRLGIQISIHRDLQNKCYRVWRVE